ncbi:MAG: MFS transporter [Candidatus Heimdallarchaeota archaeon]|nr:MFS transporter [Candidatus Heimdallarchaeota archaeon]MCK4770432.1 MFS transporter [Candidatus Heimdallarchaeota archaeon]
MKIDTSSEPDKSNSIKKREERALYSRTIATSTSRGLVQPFVSMIALTMGASAGILGWIQSISNLLSTFLGPIFGRLSDLVKRRIPFVVISTLTWGIPYVILYWIIDPWVIVLIVALVNLLASLGVPAFSALQNELFPGEVRAKLTGRIFWFDAVGSAVATLITGVILTIIFNDKGFELEQRAEIYQKFILIPIAIGVLISIIGILPFRKIEEPLKNKSLGEQPITHSLKESFKITFSNKPFAKFTLISMIQAIFFSFSWPIFSIFQVSILEANALQMAVLSISFSVMIILVIRFGAKLSDRFGRTKLIAFNRLALVLFPFAYIFASKIWHLYIIHFILAGIIFIGSPSIQAYLLDIVPPREGGVYFGIHSMLVGIFMFIGSLAGGYLTEMFDNWYPLLTAVKITLGIAAGGRLLTGLLFLTLKEVKKFPSSWGEAWKHLQKRFKLEPPV